MYPPLNGQSVLSTSSCAEQTSHSRQTINQSIVLFHTTTPINLNTEKIELDGLHYRFGWLTCSIGLKRTCCSLASSLTLSGNPRIKKTTYKGFADLMSKITVLPLPKNWGDSPKTNTCLLNKDLRHISIATYPPPLASLWDQFSRNENAHWTHCKFLLFGT